MVVLSSCRIPHQAFSSVYEQLQAPIQLFQTSRRSDSGKGGIGLGLSVAAGIVHAHSGAIKLSNTTPGLLVSITIPKRD